MHSSMHPACMDGIHESCVISHPHALRTHPRAQLSVCATITLYLAWDIGGVYGTCHASGTMRTMHAGRAVSRPCRRPPPTMPYCAGPASSTGHVYIHRLAGICYGAIACFAIEYICLFMGVSIFFPAAMSINVLCHFVGTILTVLLYVDVSGRAASASLPKGRRNGRAGVLRRGG